MQNLVSEVFMVAFERGGHWVETIGTRTEQGELKDVRLRAFYGCFWCVPISKMNANMLVAIL